MSIAEWILIGTFMIAANVPGWLFMRSADQYHDKAKKHLDDALAAINALDEAIALFNYGAHAEAVALLREHGIRLRERAE